LNLREFANETASESMAPGGGSISAYVGALGISLATMVANLSSHKRGWDDRWEEFSEWAERGQAIKDKLLQLVDEDTKSFNAIINAFRLPKGTEAEKVARKEAVQAATRYAIEIPFEVMKYSLKSLEVIKVMAEIGNPNSISDAAVGGLCARAAIHGAFLNVKINSGDLEDKVFVEKVLNEAQKMIAEADRAEKELLQLVHEKME
jgi:glutamate formiminotransferase/formiminotetrahydrofolate cyclodeaminase